MKKIIVISLLVAVLSMIGGYSASAEQGRWGLKGSIGLAVGATSLEGSSLPSAGEVLRLGLEYGLTPALSIGGELNFYLGGYFLWADAQGGTTLFAKYSLAPGWRFSPYVGAGLEFFSTKVETKGVERKETGTGVAFFGGAEIYLNPDIAINGDIRLSVGSADDIDAAWLSVSAGSTIYF